MPVWKWMKGKWTYGQDDSSWWGASRQAGLLCPVCPVQNWSLSTKSPLSGYSQVSNTQTQKYVQIYKYIMPSTELVPMYMNVPALVLLHLNTLGTGRKIRSWTSYLSSSYNWLRQSYFFIHWNWNHNSNHYKSGVLEWQKMSWAWKFR